MRIAIQTGVVIDEYGMEEGYKMFAEAGFEAVDFNIDHALDRATFGKEAELRNICIFEQPLEKVMEYYREELDIMKKYGIAVSQAHAPFPPYIPGRPETLDYCIGIYRRCIEFCQAIDCKNLVIHGISNTSMNKYDTPEDIKKLNYKLYSSLIDTLKDTDVIVCLENLPVRCDIPEWEGGYFAGVCSNPYEAVEYIDTLNEMAGKECFGLCFDVGHLHIAKTRFCNYIPIVGKRIKALHIHDNSIVYDTHKAPYTGTVRWAEFIEEMNKIGYEGDISFETFRQTSKSVLPPELVPSFLKLICDIGAYFRKKISEGK